MQNIENEPPAQLSTDLLYRTNLHLGNVLYMLAELDEDDRCEAFDNALKFYNEQNPDMQVLPIEGYKTFLVQESPLARLEKLLKS